VIVVRSADDNLLGGNINTIRQGISLDTSNEACIEIHAE
jgi:hypothetical protein